MSTRAEISCGVYFLPSMSPVHLVPISRFTERMVRSGLVTACRLATSPTSTSPFLANATIDGVVRDPSAFSMTLGSPPSSTLTTEFVVPRSMPTARAMFSSSTSVTSVCPTKVSGLDSILPRDLAASSEVESATRKPTSKGAGGVRRRPGTAGQLLLLGHHQEPHSRSVAVLGAGHADLGAHGDRAELGLGPVHDHLAL